MPFITGRRGIPQRSNIYALFLLLQLADRIGTLDPKPPVTISIIVLNLLIYYSRNLSGQLPAGVVSFISPFLSQLSVRTACLHPTAVIRGEWFRLISASFFHLSDTHVLFNSLSFLYKGVSLEAVYGSVHFLALILYLSITSHVLYVATALVAWNFDGKQLVNNCVAGFSGVIFGLKVILNANPQYGQTATRIFGLPFPGGAAPWTELVIVSALIPNSSFLGHLCGILAGLLYIYTPKVVSRVVTTINRMSPMPRTYRPFQGRPRHLHED